MAGPHDKLIARAAQAALKRLGFSRMGRSRIWIADRGWWLMVVQFQPSAWSKGAFLNVAAHWLWQDGGYLTFDFAVLAVGGSRVEGFAEYVDDASYADKGERLARSAADEGEKLCRLFPAETDAARVLTARERSLPAQARGSWSARRRALGVS